MSKISLPINGSVVLSLIFIHGVLLAAQSQLIAGGSNNENNESINQQDAERAIYGNQLIDVASDQQQQSQAVKKSLVNLNRDDYHTNIDLDKLNDAYRYEMLDGAGGSLGPNNKMELYSSQNNDDNPLKSETLINKLINSRNNRFSRGQYYVGKRLMSSYPKALLNLDKKEDKDYAFVIEPESANELLARAALTRNKQQQMSQDFASKASLWATDVLRDLQRQGLAAQTRPRHVYQPASPPTHYSARFGLKNERGQRQQQADNNDIVQPDYREKRRRCKMDPNLGVKNPSFCDTDAYFGAADYSMRDVWDSAGRRR